MPSLSIVVMTVKESCTGERGR